MNGPPTPGGGPYDHPIGDDRNQVLRLMAVDLKKVPGVEAVRFEDSSTGVEQELVADVDTDIFANSVIDADEASITINWWPLHDEDKHWYQFHYHDSSGFDCGWHRQQNPHVEELNHYQERASPDEEYEYYQFDSEHSHPIGLLWEIVAGRLESRVEIRYGDD